MGKSLHIFCPSHKLEEWKTWCRMDIDKGRFSGSKNPDWYSECQVGYIDYGAYAMEVGFRLLCIAAYRKFEIETATETDNYTKTDLLAALIQVCPPDSATLNRKNQDSTTRLHNVATSTVAELLYGSMLPSWMLNSHDIPPVMDMLALQTDEVLTTKLRVIGLGPMVDWVTRGCQVGGVRGDIICACAPMFTEFLPYVPARPEDLEGTPYHSTGDIGENIDGWSNPEYRQQIEPSFRNAASFGTECYGVHY